MWSSYVDLSIWVVFVPSTLFLELKYACLERLLSCGKAYIRFYRLALLVY